MTPKWPVREISAHQHGPIDTVMNLAELEVFAKAGAINLAAGKTVTSSAFHPAGPLPPSRRMVPCDKFRSYDAQN